MAGPDPVAIILRMSGAGARFAAIEAELRRQIPGITATAMGVAYVAAGRRQKRAGEALVRLAEKSGVTAAGRAADVP